MSKEYAEQKIREALSFHDGNVTRARKQIMAQARSDFKLMRGLADPHLDGIIAYQVERVSSGRAELEKRHPEAAKKSNTQENSFGMDLLRAVAATAAPVFGQQSPMGVKRRSASNQHIEAIHKIAASRTKDDLK